jgi:hypothetical protein
VIATHAKGIVSLLFAILAAVLPAVTDTGMGVVEWINVAALALGTFHVYNASNDLPGWPVAKAIAAVLSAVLVAVASYVSFGISTTEWIQIAMAGLGAAAVYLTPNRQPLGRHARRDDP